MKRIIALVVMVALAATLVSCGVSKAASGSGSSQAQKSAQGTSNQNNEETKERLKMRKVEIKIKDYGTIKLELDPNEAPITVDNFMKLVNKKFYDGLTFHRIIEGFMMQGGDPKGDGTGGSEEQIKGEFSSNGVKNNISHKRGVISMARSMNPNSASSQFFICHKDSEFLDGEYAAFGHVTDGMDVVDKVCTSAEVIDGNGTVAPGKKPVIEYIKEIK